MARKKEADTIAEAPQAPSNGKKVYPKQRSWAHDNTTGVELNSYSSTDEKLFEVRIQFRDGKPSEAVRQYLKDNDFRWESDREPGPNFGQAGAWVHPIAYIGAQDRLVAERVYFDVTQMLHKEQGAGRGI